LTSFFAMAAYSGSHSWSTIHDRRTHPQLEAMVREKVGSGQYNDAGEVVREALQLMDERDLDERLRTAIAVGLKQIERGEIIPWTADFMDRVIREADEEDRQQ
jgi:putative addiction module CopG family antidote